MYYLWHIIYVILFILNEYYLYEIIYIMYNYIVWHNLAFKPPYAQQFLPPVSQRGLPTWSYTAAAHLPNQLVLARLWVFIIDRHQQISIWNTSSKHNNIYWCLKTDNNQWWLSNTSMIYVNYIYYVLYIYISINLYIYIIHIYIYIKIYIYN